MKWASHIAVAAALTIPINPAALPFSAARTQAPAGFAETQWQTAAHQPLAGPEKPQENGNVIRMIVVCAAVAAAVFTVFSIIAALLSSVTVSAVLMIVAVGAVVVALAGLILSGKA